MNYLLVAATNDPLGPSALADWHEEAGLVAESAAIRNFRFAAPAVGQCLFSRWDGGYGGYGGYGGHGGDGGVDQDG